MRRPSKTPHVKPDATSEEARRRQRALELIGEGATNGAVAKALAVSRTTVWRWCQEDDFRETLHALQERRRQAAGQRCTALALSAVRYLASVLKDPAVSTALRLRAAEQILDRSGVVTTITRGARGDGPMEPLDGLSDSQLEEELARLVEERRGATARPAQEGA